MNIWRALYGMQYLPPINGVMSQSHNIDIYYGFLEYLSQDSACNFA